MYRCAWTHEATVGVFLYCPRPCFLSQGLSLHLQLPIQSDWLVVAPGTPPPRLCLPSAGPAGGTLAAMLGSLCILGKRERHFTYGATFPVSRTYFLFFYLKIIVAAYVHVHKHTMMCAWRSEVTFMEPFFPHCQTCMASALSHGAISSAS